MTEEIFHKCDLSRYRNRIVNFRHVKSPQKILGLPPSSACQRLNINCVTLFTAPEDFLELLVCEINETLMSDLAASSELSADYSANSSCIDNAGMDC